MAQGRNQSTRGYYVCIHHNQSQISPLISRRDPKALWERVKRQRDDTEVEEAFAQAGPSSRRTVKKPDMSKFALLSDEEPYTPEIIVSLEKWKART